MGFVGPKNHHIVLTEQHLTHRHQDRRNEYGRQQVSHGYALYVKHGGTDTQHQETAYGGHLRDHGLENAIKRDLAEQTPAELFALPRPRLKR